MKKLVWYIAIALVCYSCSNLEDAQPEQRNSFVYFYGSDQNMISAGSALDADGIISVGYLTQNLVDKSKPSMVLIKTDLKGKTIWQQVYPKLAGKGVTAISDGYLVVADSIEIVNDVVTSAISTNYYLKFFRMDQKGNIAYRFTSPPSSNSFLANAVTVDQTGNVAVLGTVVKGANNKLSILYTFKPIAGTPKYTPQWSQEFDLNTRSYSNGHALLQTPDNTLIWPSAILAPLSGRSYAAFPVVQPGNTYTNNRLFGENDDTFNYSANDLAQISGSFATVGTVYTVAGGATPLNTNFYFMRLDRGGNIIAGSDKYYDNGSVTEKGSSNVDDVGLALTASSDGSFLLAGALTSTPTVGNGGKDLLVIKVDGFGGVIWTKTYGGSGDEVVNTVLQSPDGGYFICGTSTVQNFSSMFVIKLNSQGELTN